MNRELSTHLYIAAFAIAAVAVSALAALLWPMGPHTPSLWLLPVLALLIVLADHFAVISSRQTDVSLFTVPLYIAVLLAHPTEAALVGAAGVLISQIIARRPARAVVFNTSVTALTGAVAGIVYFSLRPEGASLALTQGHIVAALLAGLVLHLQSILPVVGIVTIRKGVKFWRFWAESYLVDSVVDGMLLSLGLIAAVVTVQASWGLAIMALPAIGAQRILKQTVEHSAKKGMLAEELELRLRNELDSMKGFNEQASRQVSDAAEIRAGKPSKRARP